MFNLIEDTRRNLYTLMFNIEKFQFLHNIDDMRVELRNLRFDSNRWVTMRQSFKEHSNGTWMNVLLDDMTSTDQKRHYFSRK